MSTLGCGILGQLGAPYRSPLGALGLASCIPYLTVTFVGFNASLKSTCWDTHWFPSPDFSGYRLMKMRSISVDGTYTIRRTTGYPAAGFCVYANPTVVADFGYASLHWPTCDSAEYGFAHPTFGQLGIEISLDAQRRIASLKAWIEIDGPRMFLIHPLSLDGVGLGDEIANDGRIYEVSPEHGMICSGGHVVVSRP